MRITKTFEITFEEPCPHWLCADNLAIVLRSVCTNSQFEVVETARSPEYPEEGLNEDEIVVPPEELLEERVLRGASWTSITKRLTSNRTSHGIDDQTRQTSISGFRIAKRRKERSIALHGGSWVDSVAYCQSVHRHAGGPGWQYSHLGFRLARKKG